MKKIITTIMMSLVLVGFTLPAQARAASFTLPANFIELSKNEQITILKLLIAEISGKIKKIIAQKTAYENVSYVSYTDKRGSDFSLKYPKTWKAKTYSDDNVFDFKVESPANNINRFVVISVEKSQINLGGKKVLDTNTLMDMSENNINYFKRRFDEVEIVKNKKTVVNGKKGVDVIISYYDDLLGKKIFKRQVVLLDSKNMTLIDIDYTAEDKSKVEPIFNYMIKNFKTLN